MLSSYSQNKYYVGLLANINLNTQVKQNWRLNFKIESRQQFFEGVTNEFSRSKYNYILTDFALLLSKKVGLNNTFAAGYLSRFRNEQYIHRFIQQYTIVHRLSMFRMAHRFSADQTFSKNTKSEYRFRYRLTTELPLNGKSIDANELYIKFNNEYLNAVEGDDYDLEIRLVPLMGYKFAENNKLEAGLDFRVNSFINGVSNNRYWLSVNWYVNIDS